MGAFGTEATMRDLHHPKPASRVQGMGDIVNLRRARRKAVRQAAERKAAANRLLHGRSKAARDLEALRGAKAQRDLDRHRIVTEDER
jgi:hypothetical protein